MRSYKSKLGRVKRLKINLSGDPLTGAHDLIWRHLGWVYPEGIVLLDTWAQDPVPRIYPLPQHTHVPPAEEVLLSLNTHGNWCLISKFQESWSGYCPLRGGQPDFWVDMASEPDATKLERRCLGCKAGLSFGHHYLGAEEFSPLSVWNWIHYGDTIRRHLRQKGNQGGLLNLRDWSRQLLKPGEDVHPLGSGKITRVEGITLPVLIRNRAEGWRLVPEGRRSWTRLGGVVVEGPFFTSIAPQLDPYDPYEQEVRVFKPCRMGEAFAFEDSKGRLWSASSGSINLRETWV